MNARDLKRAATFARHVRPYDWRMAPNLLTADEVADRLSLTPARVKRLAKRDELPHVSLPGGEVRFSAEDLDRWIEDRKRGPDGSEAIDAS